MASLIRRPTRLDVLPSLDDDVVLGVQNLLELFDHTGDPSDAAIAARLRGAITEITPGPVMAFVNTTDPRDFGAKADGVTDDTQAYKDAIATITKPKFQTGGRLFVPGLSVISDTLELRRFTGEMFGQGWSSLRGSGFLWEGLPGIPMLRIRECEGATFRQFRLSGHATDKPVGVEMRNQLGDGDAWANQLNTLQLRIGPHPEEGLSRRMKVGVLFTGTRNTNNDNNRLVGCKIRYADTGIRLTQSQAVLNNLEACYITQCGVGIDTTANFLRVENLQSTDNDLDVRLRQDAQLWADTWHTESSKKVLLMDGYNRVWVNQASFWLRNVPLDNPFVEDLAGGEGSSAATVVVRGGSIKADASQNATISLGTGGTFDPQHVGLENIGVT